MSQQEILNLIKQDPLQQLFEGGCSIFWGKGKGEEGEGVFHLLSTLIQMGDSQKLSVSCELVRLKKKS